VKSGGEQTCGSGTVAVSATDFVGAAGSFVAKVTVAFVAPALAAWNRIGTSMVAPVPRRAAARAPTAPGTPATTT